MTSRNLLMGGSSGTLYVDDVFKTHLYEGSAGEVTVNNGIQLYGTKSLVWIKSRSAISDNHIFTNSSGVNDAQINRIISNSTAGLVNDVNNYIQYSEDTGFSIPVGTLLKNAGEKYVSWTFRKASKFFDTTNYSGNGDTSLVINHNLGSVPGCIIVKRVDAPGAWYVYHRRMGSTDAISNGLTLTVNSSAAMGSSTVWANTSPTNQSFTVGGLANVATGIYEVMLFAHEAGGFGETGNESIISCISFDADADGFARLNLPFEPEFLLYKSKTLGDWNILDRTRGFNFANSFDINPNLTDAESTITVTRASRDSVNNLLIKGLTVGNSYIAIAVRKSQKPPEFGSEVFQPVTYTATNVDNRLVDTGIKTDAVFARVRNSANTPGFVVGDRSRGNAYLSTATTAAQLTDSDSLMTPTVGVGNSFSAMNGFGVGNDLVAELNSSTTNQLAYAFKEAPKFFDIVNYTGNGTSLNVPHSLTSTPTMIIFKNLALSSWVVWLYENPPPFGSAINTSVYGVLDTTAAAVEVNSFFYDTSSNTQRFLDNTNIPIGSSTLVNTLNANYVAYLFTSTKNISKNGTYTGNGTTLTVNCDFLSGARFVMIKRLNTTGSWYVWDTARGIVDGSNDPQLDFDGVAAEIATNNSIDNNLSGFTVIQNTGTNVNVSGATYFYMAIA